MERRKLFPAAALAGAILVLSACSPGRAGLQQHTVFAPRGYTDWLPTTTRTDQNVGIPQLLNDSGQAVHVLAARFQSVAPAVHTLYVAAYSSAHGNNGLGSGNFEKKPCRQQYTPSYPVTDDVIPPHSIGNKYLNIGFIITKPGTYHIRLVRITYKTGGREYWQDVSIGLTVRVTIGKAQPPSC